MAEAIMICTGIVSMIRSMGRIRRGWRDLRKDSWTKFLGSRGFGPFSIAGEAMQAIIPILRPLTPNSVTQSLHELDDKTNTEIMHEHLFFGYKPQNSVGKPGTPAVKNIGFGPHGIIDDTNGNESKRNDYEQWSDYYDDKTMQEAIDSTKSKYKSKSYNLPTSFCKPKQNCQDFATALKKEYGKIWTSRMIEKGKEDFGR